MHTAYLPVEAYPQRMTELLMPWDAAAFERLGKVTIIDGDSAPIPLDAFQGEVLDAVRRPLWAMAQTASLLPRLDTFDHVYFGDFYHPGLDALAYCRKRRPPMSAFMWAQTFDQFDFTQQFIGWMRAWETMGFGIYDNVFVANSLLRELVWSYSPELARKVHVVGLPFNSQDVLRRLPGVHPTERIYDVVFSSRLDIEKDIGTFARLVYASPQLRFAVCSGHPTLKGTDTKGIAELEQAAQKHGNVHFVLGATKADYYKVLAQSKVQLNTALQDWTSFTLLEALTFGCYPCYPMHRSFCEVFADAAACLYAPGNLASLQATLRSMLAAADTIGPSTTEPSLQQILKHHDGTHDRILQICRP